MMTGRIGRQAVLSVMNSLQIAVRGGDVVPRVMPTDGLDRHDVRTTTDAIVPTTDRIGPAASTLVWTEQLRKRKGRETLWLSVASRIRGNVTHGGSWRCERVVIRVDFLI